MRRIIVSIVCSYFLSSYFFVSFLFGQTSTGTITGSVSNSSNEPLINVSVVIRNNPIGTTTNENGVFSFNQLPTGSYDIEFSYVGYTTKIEKVEVKSGRITHVNLTLMESDYSLNEVTIVGERSTIQISRLPDVHQTYLTAGKKNEVISLKSMNVNLAEKTGRQLFAKVPGVFVYDMDGSGNQVNISTRGLDPHRSWEYNIRQNGVITNSDMYGYPASHYSPPMESIERIELIRGTASLQYGAQFGGMINYVTKSADSSKVIGFESLNTTGSYGLFSSYNALGGKKGKWQYYAYYYKRVSDGYRQNSRSNADAQFAELSYFFNRHISLKAQLGHSSYIYQLPGPLTDSMFNQNPRQSTRSRNYFNPNIYLPSLTFDWIINEHTKLNFITSAVLGQRNSVLLDAFASVADIIDTATNAYKPRQVDIDNFNSYSSELRLLHAYHVGQFRNVLSGGIRFINNDLHRRQLGKGTSGSDFDLTLTTPGFGRDLHFRTSNIAFFVENLLYLTSKLSLTPGFRYENGITSMSGVINYYPPGQIPNNIKHHFPLFGLAMQYQVNSSNRIYGGFSQAYRPVIFKDIIPGSMLERANKDLKDARGYNAELGLSGTYKGWLQYDVSVFQISYHNKLGSLVLMDENEQSYIYKTNIGNSLTRGLELYTEFIPIKRKNLQVSVFTSSSYFDSFYQKAVISTSNENKDISGNRVESVPKWISRSGINIFYKKVSATLLYSYVSETFSDALNTRQPAANGARGIVPEYSLLDANATLHFAGNYSFKLGVNNLLNKQYFTKRPTFYPGPGIWPSDGRTIFVSLGVKL